MKESDHKRRLVAEVNALRGGYARRIEDRFAVGVLDLIIKLPFHSWIWAEGKIIDGFKFAPTERQWVEGERILKTGTLAVLIGWKAARMYVSPWVKQADLRECYDSTSKYGGMAGMTYAEILEGYLNESRRQST